MLRKPTPNTRRTGAGEWNDDVDDNTKDNTTT
jgi:hypothetical protein